MHLYVINRMKLNERMEWNKQTKCNEIKSRKNGIKWNEEIKWNKMELNQITK